MFGIILHLYGICYNVCVHVYACVLQEDGNHVQYVYIVWLLLLPVRMYTEGTVRQSTYIRVNWRLSNRTYSMV